MKQNASFGKRPYISRTFSGAALTGNTHHKHAPCHDLFRHIIAFVAFIWMHAVSSSTAIRHALLGFLFLLTFYCMPTSCSKKVKEADKLRGKYSSTFDKLSKLKADCFIRKHTRDCKRYVVFIKFRSNTHIGNDILKEVGNITELWTIGLNRTNITDEGLKHLSDIKRLEVLSVECPNISNNAIKHIVLHKQMRALSLAHTKITSSGIASLSTLKHFKGLSLSHTKISDSAAKELRKHLNIEILDLSHTDITCVTVSHLSKLRNLKRLYLDGTSVGDECIVNLTRLATLKRLSLKNAMLSRRGIDKITKSLPDCMIEYLPLSENC